MDDASRRPGQVAIHPGKLRSPLIMTRFPVTFGFALLVTALAPSDVPASDVDTIGADEQTLREAGLDPSGPRLVEYLRGDKPDAARRVLAQQLIARLGDGSAVVRHQAAQELTALGPSVAPLLRRELAGTPDVAAAARLKRCLRRVSRIQDSAVVEAAVRLLAVRRPPGGAEALLSSLSPETSAELCGELQQSLTSLALQEGQPDPALLRALSDRTSVRRAAAAMALLQAGGSRLADTVRPLLKDPDLVVRLRVAMELALQSDGGAVPVLISLLTELPATKAAEAEKALRELAGDMAPTMPVASNGSARRQDRDAWANWWTGIDDERFLQAIRRAVPTEVERERLATLIGQLKNDDFAAREMASTRLQEGGPAAVALLRRATHDPDFEVARRAKDCLQHMGKSAESSIMEAAPGLLALRKPPGSAEALLAYLPLTESGPPRDRIERALVALALEKDKPRTCLLLALGDRSAVRRAIAGVALCRAAGTPLLQVLPLLRDTDPAVRLRVGIALAEAGEPSALPTLVALLTQLPADQTWEVEELLGQIAGPTAPPGRQGWQDWWKKHGGSADLGRLRARPRFRGYTLIVEFDTNGLGGRVREVSGPDNRQRWEIHGLALPVDAQVLPGNHVLLAEYGANRVTERDFLGRVVWERNVATPVSVQRLPDGQTFVASRYGLSLFDRWGKETPVHLPSRMMLCGARRLPDGGIVLMDFNGILTRLDPKGKELKRFAIGQQRLGGLEVLPNGHVVAAQPNVGNVVEFDEDGRQVWEAEVSMPWSATRLMNGHTLVTCQGTPQVIELDRSGKTVWQYHVEGRPWLARRR